MVCVRVCVVRGTTYYVHTGCNSFIFYTIAKLQMHQHQHQKQWYLVGIPVLTVFKIEISRSFQHFPALIPGYFYLF